MMPFGGPWDTAASVPHPKAEGTLREVQRLKEYATGGNLRSSPTEIALQRMAGALEKLVEQQSQTQPLDATEVILEWLSTIDPADLDHAVMVRRTGLREPVMWTVLEELKDRAHGYRA